MIGLTRPTTSTSDLDLWGSLWTAVVKLPQRSSRSGRAGSTVIVNHLSGIVFTTKVFCRRTPFYP